MVQVMVVLMVMLVAIAVFRLQNAVCCGDYNKRVKTHPSADGASYVSMAVPRLKSGALCEYLRDHSTNNSHATIK
jgi:hypothetical protein